MARIVNGVLGKVSGRMGINTFYIREGKTYSASRPEHYNQKSEKLKKAQGHFGAINKFASPVFKEAFITEIWKKAAPLKSYRYQYFLSANSGLFKDGHPSVENIITPPGEESPISELQYNSGKIHVRLNREAEGKIILFLVPFYPVDQKALPFQVIKAGVTDIPGCEFDVNLNVSFIKIVNKYSKYIIYSAVVNNESWTETVAMEGIITKAQ